MRNTISYKELKQWYLENETAVENAKVYFGEKQPSVYQTGFYSSPSWNWCYVIGIVGIKDENSTKWFEVVTQFGEVKAAKGINLPEIEQA